MGAIFTGIHLCSDNNLRVSEVTHTKSLFLAHTTDPITGEQDARMGGDVLDIITQDFRLRLYCFM